MTDDTTSGTSAPNLADLQTSYMAALKAKIDAADANDAPILAQIAALQATLSSATDPTLQAARGQYHAMGGRRSVDRGHRHHGGAAGATGSTGSTGGHGQHS